MLVCFSKPHTLKLVCVRGHIFSWHDHKMCEEKWRWWRWRFRRRGRQAGDFCLSLRFNICKCDTAGYFQGDLETIPSRICGDKTGCFKQDLGTPAAMFVETKSGILSHNMMFWWFLYLTRTQCCNKRNSENWTRRNRKKKTKQNTAFH